MKILFARFVKSYCLSNSKGILPSEFILAITISLARNNLISSMSISEQTNLQTAWKCSIHTMHLTLSSLTAPQSARKISLQLCPRLSGNVALHLFFRLLRVSTVGVVTGHFTKIQVQSDHDREYEMIRQHLQCQTNSLDLILLH